MSIAMVSDGRYSERIRVSNEARAMVAAGAQVTVHMLVPGGESRRFEEKGVKVVEHRLPRWCFKAKALAAEFPFYSWVVRRVLRRALEGTGPDVIHVHNLFSWRGAYGCRDRHPGATWVLDIAENLPEIMKEYDHVKHGPGRHLVRISAWIDLQRKAVQEADHVVLVTQAAVEDYVEHVGLDRSKALVCDNIPWRDEIGDEQLEEVQDRFKDSFVVFYFGDTSTRRGTDVAIEAMPKVIEKVPNAQLVIVGRNRREDAKLRAMRKQSPARESIHLEGFQPMDRLGAYLEAADVGLSPLVRNTHHDTTHANKLFQFMHGALPLVVSDCPAQAELVKTTGTGVVHRAGDADGLAEALIYLAEHPETREVMGQRGRELVDTEVLWERAIEPYMEAMA